MESDFGKEAAALLARAGLESMEMIKNFVQELNIGCDLEPKSAWLYAEDKQQAKQLKEILEASKRAGCTVLFNPSEKSWDCPCHGGRFDVSGRVLNGPPTKDLEAVVISYEV